MSSKKILYVALTFDVENDFDYFLNESRLKDRTKFGWLGIEKGIPSILKALNGFEDAFGNGARATWFARVDGTLKKEYGDEGYLLVKHDKLWKSLLREGHEIGLHPHLYRPFRGAWLQETREEYLVDKLEKSYEAMTKHGFLSTSSRIGEAYMTNEIMATLSRLGIKIDSTALPGRFRKDSVKSIDWRGSSQTPYRPSKTNYRVTSETPLDIIEAPMSTVETKVDYDKRPLRRYVNLSFHNEVLQRGIGEHIQSNDLLVTVTHVFEILPELAGKKKHPLISFDVGELRKNIETIINECSKAKKKYKFIRLSDIVYLVKENSRFSGRDYAKS